MIKNFSIIIFCILSVNSCKENPIVGINENSFSIEVQVVDPNGNPLPNINISSWNEINLVTALKKINSKSENNAATSIPYTILEKCYVELTIYDLNGKIKEKIVSGQREAGRYSVSWETLSTNGVFKCKLITSSDPGMKNILFQDSIYIVQNTPDAKVSSLGKTDINGKIKTADKLLFPHLFNLPLIPYTSEVGPEVLGYFSFSDSVTIALSDESFLKTRLYKREIKNIENKLSLKWDGTLLKGLVENQRFKNVIGRSNIFNVDNVGFTSFTASFKEDSIVLDWKTAEETNNIGFEIERDSNSSGWDKIGFVNGRGTTHEISVYSFQDKNVTRGGTYRYRLKAVDNDGSYQYTNEIVVNISFPMGWKLFQNYPNPFN